MNRGRERELFGGTSREEDKLNEEWAGKVEAAEEEQGEETPILEARSCSG